MAEPESKDRTCGRWPQGDLWGKPKGCALKTADQQSLNSLVAPACLLLRLGAAHRLAMDKQPPAAPAAAEVASVHLARWAPHPSADTAPETEPSPRTPALGTMPPRQKLVDKATSGEAVVPPVADPSSLPVAESSPGRAAHPMNAPGLLPRGSSSAGWKGKRVLSGTGSRHRGPSFRGRTARSAWN